MGKTTWTHMARLSASERTRFGGSRFTTKELNCQLLLDVRRLELLQNKGGGVLLKESNLKKSGITSKWMVGHNKRAPSGAQ